MKRNKTDVYEIVTNQVIELLERGTVPWRKPWNGKDSHPCNAVTGCEYRGINPFTLNTAQLLFGFTDHRWLTFKQVKDAGGSVKKGSSSSVVVFWNWVEKIDPETGEKEKFPILKYYRVFNFQQTEGIDESKLKAPPSPGHTPHKWDAIESAEDVAGNYLERTGLASRLKIGGTRAAYCPPLDSLIMPDRDRFESAEEWYSTLFHELAHSTGHPSRLNRDMGKGFGSESYSREELIAEFGAAFLCGFTGIESKTIENSAAYIRGWLKALKADKRLLPTAAAAAQKAADLILGHAPEAAAEDDATPAIVSAQ